MHSVLQRHSDLTETKGIIYRYENDGRFYAKRRCIQDLRCPSTDVTAHRRAWNVLSEGASPFLFEPDMNWIPSLARTSSMVIGTRLSFFWSKDHAREFRQNNNQPDGVYLRLDQAAFSERIARSGLFAIDPDGACKTYRTGFRKCL